MKESNDEFIVKHQFFENAMKTLQLCYDSFGSKHPRCTAVVGPTGCGKSTMIEEFERSLGPCEDRQMKRVVVIEMPSSTTVRSLASEVLKAIGDPNFHKGVEALMTARIIKLLKKIGTRLLIFDEVQNLIDKDLDKWSYKASDWLKRLINLSKVPTVFVGLEQTEELFLVNKQLRRRFTASYIFEPFDWKKSSNLLKGFLKALQKKYCFVEGLDVSDNDMAFRFYCASGGLVGYLMSIVREAKRLADIADGSGPISLNHLIEGYNLAVCGNGLVGVNPFSCNERVSIEAALHVVEDAKPPQRRHKKK